MPDIYTNVTEAAPQILEGLMTALELRAADPQQRAMLHTYLTDAALPQGARVLEVGCGTGAVTRVLATWPGVAKTIGVDPSPVFVAKAVALRYSKATTPQARSPREPETRWTPVPRRFESTSCMILGWYGGCRRWCERRVFNIECVRSYGYVETSKPGFMLPSWVDLGADALVASGRIGADMAAALKAEARRRIASGEYFGHIAYMSVVALKPV